MARRLVNLRVCKDSMRNMSTTEATVLFSNLWNNTLLTPNFDRSIIIFLIFIQLNMYFSTCSFLIFIFRFTHLTTYFSMYNLQNSYYYPSLYMCICYLIFSFKYLNEYFQCYFIVQVGNLFYNNITIDLIIFLLLSNLIVTHLYIFL